MTVQTESGVLRICFVDFYPLSRAFQPNLPARSPAPRVIETTDLFIFAIISPQSTQRELI
jgi:hypothetical protein